VSQSPFGDQHAHVITSGNANEKGDPGTAAADLAVKIIGSP
jgi:hypothetical protein